MRSIIERAMRENLFCLIPFHAGRAMMSCFFCLERERFLDKEMPFVTYDEFGYLKMGLGRSCHGEAIKILLYRIPHAGKCPYIGIFLLAFGERIAVGLNNSCKTAETMQGLYMIFTPAAGANDTDFFYS